MAAQRGQGVEDAWLGDMPFEVDEEPVLAEVVAGRPRVQPGQVDAAGGQLGQQLGQRAGAVGGGGHDGRPVGAGRRRQLARRADQQEPRCGVGDIGDLGGDDLQRVVLDRDRGADGGVEVAFEDTDRGSGGGRRRDRLRAGQVRLQPLADLRERVRMAGHRANLLVTGPFEHAEVDRQDGLGDGDQRGRLAQPVEGRRHRPLHGVLDRDAGVVGFTGAYGGQRQPDGLGRNQFLAAGEHARGLFGEGPLGPEIRDP